MIAVLKEYNMRWHYDTMHHEKYDAFTGKIREEKVRQFKAAFANEILCPDRKKVFEGISLSANTVACRITDLADNVQKQLIQMAKDFEAFSIALDESTDVSDTAQCAVFIRGVDCNITEELLDLMPLKGTTTGHDIFQGLEECIEKAVLPWNKLVSLATDGAPSMCSENVDVVGLLKTKLNSLNIPGINFSSIHCILHQEALCSKSLQMKEVMDVVVKTINFICAQGLNHRQFTSFLASMDNEYGKLLYHTEVRWLSCGNILKHFFALREEIDSFMKMKNKEVRQLADSTFICNLAFLTDVTDHLNALNLKLQGRKQVITQMYDSVKSFKVKLTLWGKQLTAGNLVHFLTLNSLGKVEPKSLKEYADIISNLHKQFDVRFKDFKALEPHFQPFSTPFAEETDNVAEEIQMELVELQCDTILKQKYADVGIPAFYRFLSQERFPMLFSASVRVMAMFGSTYIYEQFFSSMKINKSVLRSRLTDEHLKATLRLVSSQDIKTNIDALLASYANPTPLIN
uniref:Uncharacterized protein n=1 Tax=Chrysemys picta bellii TaxID=8478 RepID=A0A8C3ISY3_CHRPI